MKTVLMSTVQLMYQDQSDLNFEVLSEYEVGVRVINANKHSAPLACSQDMSCCQSPQKKHRISSCCLTSTFFMHLNAGPPIVHGIIVCETYPPAKPDAIVGLLMCPGSSGAIRVLSATYGRSDPTICPGTAAWQQHMSLSTQQLQIRPRHF